MKVFVIRSTGASGKRLIAGKEATVSDKDARILIAYGKAVDAEDKDAVAAAKKSLRAGEAVEAKK